MKKLVHVKSLITLALCLMMCFTFFAPASTVQAKKRVVDNVFMYPTDPYSYPTCTGWVPCKKTFTSSKKASKTYVRETAWKVIDLMQDRKAQTVVKALNTIERSYGERLFRNVFKTITVDNGVEFSDAEGLERSRRNKKKKRTKVYYCHPYSSCERGSNENANRLIRRHIPKGVNFDKKRQSEIKEIETWINNYPRKLFGYNTAEEQFVYEMEKLTG